MRTLSLARCFLLLVLLVPPTASSWADFLPVGGAGGGPFELSCGGQYLAGLYGRTGEWVDQIGIICTPFVPQTAAFGAQIAKPEVKGGATGGGSQKTCPTGLAVTRFTIYLQSHVVDGQKQPQYVRGIVVDCGAQANPFLTSFCFGNCTDYVSGGQIDERPLEKHRQLCQSGGFATGVYGRYGSYVDSVAVRCAVNPATVAAPAAQAQPCASGYVWRDNFDGDTLCVKPELRHKLADGSCRAGYVWRDSFDGDAVCVTPAERDALKTAMANASKPVKSSGKSSGPSLPSGVLSCRGGGTMRMTSSSQTTALIAFAPAAQPANVAPPGPGECAWSDRLFGEKEPHQLGLVLDKPNAQSLFDAMRGGTFQVTARPSIAFILVNPIDNVQVMDSTPLSPGPVGGGDAGGGGMPQTPGDMGGMPPMQQAGGACGNGNATVVINQPGLDKLNVRTGPGGQVVGTVPEGSTVSVVGACGATAGAAGFAKPATPQPASSGWCQISGPVSGCVSAQFLAFGGGGTGLPGGAAGLTKGKQPTLALAAAGFGGSGTPMPTTSPTASR